MNNFDVFVPRKRSQNLLIVEGNHEKNELFALLFKCFPEMNIDIDDVWIYATNIYQLYDEIVSEYGEDWYDTDVDLPFVVSKKKYPDELRYKEDFVNIVLVFDYERHDTYFSEEKIFSILNPVIQELESSGVIQRDEKRWGLLHEGEDNIDNLRLYIRERLIFLDEYYAQFL